MDKIKKSFKNFFENLFINKFNKPTVNKLLTIIAFINAIVQLGLCSIHNKAVYNVYGTVAVYSFFYFILLLISAVNAMRLSENKKYYVYSFICLTIAISVGTIYIVKCLNDQYYLNALNGAIKNPYEIIWAIEDSCVLMGIGVFLVLICLILTIIEMCIRKKCKEE